MTVEFCSDWTALGLGVIYLESDTLGPGTVAIMFGPWSIQLTRKVRG